MFISSAIISALYFGGYNFPFMDSLGLSHNMVTTIGVFVFFAKSYIFHLFLYVDTLDIASFPLRPIDESWLEKNDTPRNNKCANYRMCSFALE